MNIYQFNYVIYKGNVNIQFYLHCLKKDIKLIRFLFFNIWYFILSLLISSKKDIYIIRKFRYLKYVKNLNGEIRDFYKKNRLNSYIDKKKDVVIDKVPLIFMKHILKESKIIGFELNSNFDVKLEEYNSKILNYDSARNLFLRNRFCLGNVLSNNIFIVHNNKLKYLKVRKKINSSFVNFLLIIVISMILTCFSFVYTSYILELDMFLSYFDILLFVMNFIPIFFFMILIFLISKRIHLAWLFNSLIIVMLGIANQTKILYRDDIVKFEDIALLKEAYTMTSRYDIVIRWYSILVIFCILFIFLILKRYIKKLKISIGKQCLGLFFVLLFGIGIYNYLYKNDNIYNSLGDQSLINQWISTRQYQIRGLVYPFIYTLEDGIIAEPDGYIEGDVSKILSKYDYEDISDDKKVNVIAIMLEAYNDFSKFNTIKFNEDIYEKFHKLQDNSISGTLVTSIFGGGTIVTERNFLTGYQSFPTFRGNTNSYVWYFKEQGYRTEAMHPVYGAFYTRSSVNLSLGFDKYYYYENKFSKINDSFMGDNEFFYYIIEGYEKSRDQGIPYFNFSVTYQNHGPYYSSSYDGKKYYFDNIGYDEEAYNTINEYFNGIKDTNDAIDNLITYFDNVSEPVVIILFGDHNPYLGENAIGYSEFGIDMSLNSLDGFLNYYETPYIIHANNSAKKVFNKSFVGKGNTISPMFLMNEFFDYCELDGNQYLQYMSDLKKNIDVINPYYYKEDGDFVLVDDSKYKDKILEYQWVNYYESQRKRK